MEIFLVIIIVSTVVLWACRASYRTLTGKNGCCCSSGGCSSKDKCAEFPEDNPKS
jgi:hypothetical protein